jgi:hypothetical protein
MSPNGLNVGSRVRVAKIDDTLLDSIPSKHRGVCAPLVKNRRLGAHGTVKNWELEDQKAPIINHLMLVVQHDPRAHGDNERAIYSYEELEPSP